MPAINFKKRFAEMVESGEKRQTIRPKRKDGRNPHPGDRLYFYVGLRTKGCRFLGEAICREVIPVYFEGGGIIVLGVERLDQEQKEDLAKKDGFASFDEMEQFFDDLYQEGEEQGLPFHGLLVKWDPFINETAEIKDF